VTRADGATRRRVANLEAALERAEANAADAWRDYGAAVTAERRAVVAWLRDLAVKCREEGLDAEDYALCEAAHDIAAGRHRPAGDP